MNKQQKQLIITGTLVAVLAAVSINSFSSIKKKPAPKPPVVNPPAAAAAAKPFVSAEQQSAGEKNKLDFQSERIKINWGRDPFSSAQMDKEIGASELKLKGVSFGKDKKGLAFINNEIVKKGDKIGDYEVVDIEKEKVLLKKGGQAFYLTFPEE